MTKYFVSYSHEEGFGCLDIDLNQDMNWEYIRKIKEEIERESGAKGVVILFYKKLRGGQ